MLITEIVRAWSASLPYVQIFDTVGKRLRPPDKGIAGEVTRDTKVLAMARFVRPDRWGCSVMITEAPGLSNQEDSHEP